MLMSRLGRRREVQAPRSRGADHQAGARRAHDLVPAVNTKPTRRGHQHHCRLRLLGALGYLGRCTCHPWSHVVLALSLEKPRHPLTLISGPRRAAIQHRLQDYQWRPGGGSLHLRPVEAPVPVQRSQPRNPARRRHLWRAVYPTPQRKTPGTQPVWRVFRC